MMAYQQHPGGMPIPHGQHMPGMPNHVMSQPGAQIPHNIHPAQNNFRPGGVPHAGQGGQMMAQNVHMNIHPGMNAHNMSSIQQQNPTMMRNNIAAMQAIQAQNPALFQQHQQQILQQRAMQQGTMMNPQIGINPAMQPNQWRGNPGVPLPQHMQQQLMERQQHQQQDVQGQGRMNPHLMQQIGLPNGQAGGQMPGQAPQMRQQPSMQGHREHPGAGGPPQSHPGPGHQMPPQTPQNANMQRPRPQPPPATSHPPPQATTQAQQQPPQMQQHHPQQPQDPQQQANQSGPPQQTPRNPNAPPPSGMPQNTNQQTRVQQTPQAQHQPPPTEASSQQRENGQQRMQLTQEQQAHQQQQQQQQQQQLMGHQRTMMQQRMLAQQQQQQQAINANQVSYRLYQFCQSLNTLSATAMRREIGAWQTFVSEFFSDDAIFRYQLVNSQDPSQQKESQIVAPVLARYFQHHFANGVDKVQVALGGGDAVEHTNHIGADEFPTSFIYYFKDGVQVVASGFLKATWTQGTKISTMEFHSVRQKEYVARSTLQDRLVLDLKQSPDKSKSSAKQKQQQARTTTQVIPWSSVPSSLAGKWGVFEFLQEFLETAEMMSHMRDLFEFAQKNLHLKPKDALEQLVQSYHHRGFQGQQQGLQPPPGPPQTVPLPQHHFQNPYANIQTSSIPPHVNGVLRTPSLNGPGQPNFFPSPAYSNLNLPHSVGGHTPSPHHGAMQAPAMAASQSHQGITSHSAVGSSNASPNVIGKRRRSTVRGDGTDSHDINSIGQPGPQGGNQGKVKQSPRSGKKQKGANS